MKIVPAHLAAADALQLRLDLYEAVQMHPVEPAELLLHLGCRAWPSALLGLRKPFGTLGRQSRGGGVVQSEASARRRGRGRMAINLRRREIF